MNSLSASPPVRSAWYREPMMWLVVGIPLLTVVGGLSTIVIAHRGADALVKDEWRDEALGVRQDPTLDKAAAAAGVEADVDVGAREIRVTLTSLKGIPATLTVHLSNATRASDDQRIILRPVPGQTNVFAATLESLTTSHWYIELQPPSASWRLRGEFRALPVHLQLRPPPAS
jgi:uncharacterized protein